MLRLALEHLYSAFGHYRGQSGWADPLAVLPEEYDKMVASIPVRELPPEVFEYYSWHALVLWGHNEPALKYFLPRLAESWLEGPHTFEQKDNSSDVAAEMFIRELNAVNWKHWPAAEAEAIHGFFGAWFTACIEDSKIHPGRETGFSKWDLPANRYAGEVLAYLGLLEVDIAPQLREWEGSVELSALLQLAAFIGANTDSMTRHFRIGDWVEMWGELGVNEETMRVAIAWMLKPAIRNRFEQAFLAAPDAALQIALGEAIMNLELITSVWKSQMETAVPPAWARELVMSNFN
jgi:hypothetical protein